MKDLKSEKSYIMISKPQQSLDILNALPHSNPAGQCLKLIELSF